MLSGARLGKASNEKVCILMKKISKCIHLDLFYVSDFSGSFGIHIASIAASGKCELHSCGRRFAMTKPRTSSERP